MKLCMCACVPGRVGQKRASLEGERGSTVHAGKQTWRMKTNGVGAPCQRASPAMSRPTARTCQCDPHLLQCGRLHLPQQPLSVPAGSDGWRLLQVSSGCVGWRAGAVSKAPGGLKRRQAGRQGFHFNPLRHNAPLNTQQEEAAGRGGGGRRCSDLPAAVDARGAPRLAKQRKCCLPRWCRSPRQLASPC